MKTLFFLLILCTVVYAGHITAPPPLKDMPVSLQHYLKQLYDHFGSIEVVTSNPDGSRRGSKGEKLHLQTGGSFYDCTNTDGSTTWRCVELTDIP